MTVLAPAGPTCPSTGAEAVPEQPGQLAEPGPRRRREARRRRRDAARADRAAAARAELVEIRALLVQAQALLGQGWVQGTWFAARPGAATGVPATTVPAGPGAPPAACLVGAVVLAAGGPDAVHRQATQRSLDLLWHCLHRASEPGLVRWLPAPALRTLQVQDLTGWNDAPGRSLADVLALVDAAIGRLTAELGTPARAQVVPAAVR
jgi:hypothetical protein